MHRKCLLSFLGPAALCAASSTRVAAQINLPAQAPECVRWAAADLTKALAARNIAASDADVTVAFSLAASDGGLAAGINKAEQTFALAVSGMHVQITAGGAVGALYGLEELTEQIANQRNARDWKSTVRGLHATSQAPFLEVRADNPFIHVYPLLLNDLPMWRDYIDMLARNRYNLLDMHGAYDLQSTSFPNLYPQLVEVPGYPTAGGFTPEYRAKNLASFQAIIAYAKTRGVRVSFMNYSANDNKGGIYKTDPNVTNIPAARLADYTAKAVTILIQQLPGLYMLGFRVGESMQPASFYKEAYIKGVDDAHRPDLRLYTRSWQTTQEQLEPIAQAARNGFDIEIKYNGEHLGLPYQSMQGPAYGSYSYQGYLGVPADFQIIWQIRANGTHRFWAWENTDFIRRTIRTCQLGNARGFTLEPHTAYFSVYPRDYYREGADAATYKYMWQKHWMWYYAWGRLGYDPSLGEAQIAAQFTEHYGAAGPAAYRAMQSAGEIVPLAYAYRFVGPDQRDFSPETETGNLDTKKKRARQDLLQFAENKPEDERAFAGIDAFVANKLAGKPDGRVGPFAVTARLEKATEQTTAAIGSAPAAGSPEQAASWRLLKTDLLATTAFGEYYIHRIQGMTFLDSALRTGNEADYALAVADLAASRASWKQIGAITDPVYKPLSNPLRRQSDFLWSSQLAPLEQLDATAEGFWKANRSKASDVRLRPSAAEQGARAGFTFRRLTHHVSGTSATIVAGGVTAPAPVRGVNLWWKPVPSELEWRSVPMSARNGEWFATVPLDQRGVLYMIEVVDTKGDAANLPAEEAETPYRIIPPFSPSDTVAAPPHTPSTSESVHP